MRLALRTLPVATAAILAAQMTISLLLPARGVAQGIDRKPQAVAEPVPVDEIDNLFRISPNLYSGAAPETDAAFARLKQLGIKTIVTVDGARPDVEAAHALGMQYVHIPMRYSGVDPEAAAALTRVMRESPSPVYVHCHHGKHRGPSAAAVCAISAGLFNHRQAHDFLVQAGTGENYTGLWRDVAAFKPLPDNARLPELVERAEVGTLVESMVRIDELVADLGKELASSDGIAPPGESLLTQSLLLAEEFTEAGRQLERKCREEPANQKMSSICDGLKQTAKRAIELHSALKEQTIPAARERFRDVKQSCLSCHVKHRDN